MNAKPAGNPGKYAESPPQNRAIILPFSASKKTLVSKIFRCAAFRGASCELVSRAPAAPPPAPAPIFWQFFDDHGCSGKCKFRGFPLSELPNGPADESIVYAGTRMSLESHFFLYMNAKPAGNPGKFAESPPQIRAIVLPFSASEKDPSFNFFPLRGFPRRVM